MRATRLLRHATHGPWGEASKHLSLAELEERLRLLAPPRDAGPLRLIVARGEDGTRETPERVRVTREGGIPGDAWMRDAPEKPDAQITLMRADVAELFANGQALSLFGDNLLVLLDLSRENLPTGTRLGVGSAVLEVTPEPHDGCLKFRQRFGGDALRLTAQPSHRTLRLRGLYAKVVEEGDIAVGDPVRVLHRGEAAPGP